MTVFAFAIYDHTAVRYNLPFYARNQAEACRNLAFQMEQDKESIITRFADQHSLYCVGTFDDESGCLEHDTPPVHICYLSELLDADALKALMGGFLSA